LQDGNSKEWENIGATLSSYDKRYEHLENFKISESIN